jgi:hypothetical protein
MLNSRNLKDNDIKQRLPVVSLKITTCNQQRLKRYRAHGCKEKDCTFIENCADRKEIFSKLPASA